MINGKFKKRRRDTEQALGCVVGGCESSSLPLHHEGPRKRCYSDVPHFACGWR